MARELYIGRVRSVVLLWILFLVTAGLYFFIWFYQVNRDLRRHLGRGSGPAGRLLLFLLVPVIGWYAATFMTARSVRRAQLEAGNERLIVGTYHAFWATLVPVLGWFIAAGYIQRGANRAWLKLSDTLGASVTRTVRLQCPDCDGLFSALMNPLLPRRTQCPTCGRVGDV